VQREQDVLVEDERDAHQPRRLVVDQEVRADVQLAVVFLVEARRLLEVVVDGVARDRQAEALRDPALFLLRRRLEIDPHRAHVGERAGTFDLFLEQPAAGQREDVQHAGSGEHDPARQERTVTVGENSPRTSSSRDAVTNYRIAFAVCASGACAVRHGDRLASSATTLIARQASAALLPCLRALLKGLAHEPDDQRSSP
jgi:hypothetical protein